MFEFPWLLQQAFCLTDCICAAGTYTSLLCLGSAGLCQIIEMLSQLARLKSSCVSNGSTCLNSLGLADLSLGEIIGMLFELAKSFLEASFTFNTGQLKSIFVSEIFTCLNSLGFAGLCLSESIVMLFEVTESLVEVPLSPDPGEFACDAREEMCRTLPSQRRCFERKFIQRERQRLSVQHKEMEFERDLREHQSCLQLMFYNTGREGKGQACAMCTEKIYGLLHCNALYQCSHWGCAAAVAGSAGGVFQPLPLPPAAVESSLSSRVKTLFIRRHLDARRIWCARQCRKQWLQLLIACFYILDRSGMYVVQPEDNSEEHRLLEDMDLPTHVQTDEYVGCRIPYAGDYSHGVDRGGEIGVDDDVFSE